MKKILHHSQIIMDAGLRASFDALDSSPRFERRLKFRSSPYPRFLYKYRPLDKSEHKNRLQNYLVDSMLWLSSSQSFNDPFDMTCHIVFDGHPRDKRNRVLRLLENQISPMNKAQKSAKVSELMASPEKLIETVRRAYEKNIREAGVFSLTEDPRNILMWSHYASNHTGVCLQFEFVGDVHVLTMAAPVGYSKVYPTINWTEHTNMQFASKQLGDILTCKHEGWSYEREHRIIVPSAADNYLSFSPPALTGIILGCQMTSEGEAEVRKLLIARSAKGFPAIKLYRATRHKERFKLLLLREIVG